MNEDNGDGEEIDENDGGSDSPVVISYSDTSDSGSDFDYEWSDFMGFCDFSMEDCKIQDLPARRVLIYLFRVKLCVFFVHWPMTKT